jgi:DNA methylase
MPATSATHQLQRVPLNKTEIDQALLNIERKERSNPLPWNGQFSPQLIDVLLSRYADNHPCVLDPFAGSGTLLLEASRKNLPAIASDINPAACYLARVYTLANRPLSERGELCDRFDTVLRGLHLAEMPLFGVNSGAATAAEKASIVKAVRKELCQGDALTILAALLVLCDLFDPEVQPRDLSDAWKRLRALVLSLPESDRNLKALNADARKLPVGNEQIGLVITSPPYINVFNYHQHFRQTAEALGWHLLRVARAEIGSNRKHRANRFLTVIQYCLDMAQTLMELKRVCKKQSRLIFVVGRESRVRGVPFYNGELIASIADAAGFELVIRQERVFTNRFGQAIFEDILHLVPAKAANLSDLMTSAREAAVESLRQGVDIAAGEALKDLRDAIRMASAVHPSPLYQQCDAFTPQAATKVVSA